MLDWHTCHMFYPLEIKLLLLLLLYIFTKGIVTGVIAQRFGPRNCGIVGGLFFSVGLLISAFATSTIYLQLSYGLVSGKYRILESLRSVFCVNLGIIFIIVP